MMRGLVLIGLILASGCTRPAEESGKSVVLDLVAQLDEAAVTYETGRLDIGTPPARRYLTRDWSWNEKDGNGTTFVWGGPGPSEVAFFIAVPRSLEIDFRALPYRSADGRVETMVVSLNTSRLVSIDLQEGWSEYTLHLPAEQIHAGVNLLQFEYRWAPDVVPPETDTRGRRVAVAWDWIDFPGIEASPPEADPLTGLLQLPPGSQVDFYFETPQDANLVVESILQTGEGGGQLEISSLQDGTPLRRILQFDGLYRGPAQEGRRKRYRSLPFKEISNRWPLAADGGLVRLRLESTGAFEIKRPVVTSSTGPEEPPAPLGPNRPRDLPRHDPPLVLLYVIDTLRADHLDNTQVTRTRSPAFAALMQDGVVFETTFAQSTWTKPTVASILTGQPPWIHGAENAKDALPGEIETLAERLQQGGYRTAAFSANGFVSEVFGFDNGFEHFYLTPEYDATASQVHDKALRWLADEPEQSTFLFVQTIDPHAPYSPAEPFRSQYVSETVAPDAGSVAYMNELAKTRRQPELIEIEDLKSLYSAEVASQDHQFATLIEELQTRDLYDPALIVVLSDHGEEFYEHGSWTHGRTLHREVLQVPLIIKFPHGWAAGSRISQPVQQIDLLPTLLEALGLEGAADLPGHSLLCAVEEATSGIPVDCDVNRSRPIFSTLHYHQNHWLGVIHEDWKLILPGTERLVGNARLFDLRVDRAETDNVAALYPVRVGYLSSLIRSELRRRAAFVEPKEVELDAETAERLEALGYLD